MGEGERLEQVCCPGGVRSLRRWTSWSSRVQASVDAGVGVVAVGGLNHRHIHDEAAKLPFTFSRASTYSAVTNINISPQTLPVTLPPCHEQTGPNAKL